jgi:hypothetical protein
MSRLIQIQTNFSTGETDPLIRGRIDLQQYYSALQKATNVTIIPQGGVRRRPGLRYIAELPNTIADDGIAIAPFEFSATDSYMLVIIAGRIYVFKDAALVTNINGSGNNYITVSTITAAMLPDLNWTQSADTMVFVHQDLKPIRLVRGATDASWTVEDLPFTYIPKHAYKFQEIESQMTITPSAKDGNIDITASAYTGHTGSLQAATSSTVKLDTTASATNNIYLGLYVVMTSGSQNGKGRFITDYVGSTKIATVAPDWDTPPSASDTYKVVPFALESENQYLNVKPFGRIRITEYTSDTKVAAYTEIPVADTTARAKGKHSTEIYYEDVWSSSRGWPKSATFHEGRLYFAGSKSRPSTVWGSRVGDFFNFDKGQYLDDESVEATVDTNQLNAIVNCISARDLQFFTTGSEFFVPQASLEPITPSNFFVKIATRNGCKSSIKPVAIDSGTLFIQRQGKTLNEFIYTDVEVAYITNRISLLSSHLLKDPIDMAIRRATSTDESDQLYIVNAEDGSLVCYSLLRSQQVIAPSEFVTDGEFKAVGVDVDTTYVVVKRVINGSDKYYVEWFDNTLTLDSAKTGGAASGATVAHLANETVKVIADGVVLADETANGSGVITFDRAATSSYQVGLNYDIEIKTMPVEPRLQSGSLRGFKKRIIEVTPQFYETQSARINGQEIQFRQFDTQVLDEPVAEYTGIKKIGPLLGFDYEGVITVTQGAPLKMTLLFLEYQVSAGQ